MQLEQLGYGVHLRKNNFEWKGGETQVQDMDAVYRQHAQTVFKYLMSLTHDADLAEELTQKTFYQAVRSIDRFDESCKITTWLCAIAKNQYFAYMKKHARLQVDPDVDLMSDGAGMIRNTVSAEQEVLQQVGQMELLKKLHAFPEPGREVLYLRMFGNLSFREIGEVMGKTENWARVIFFRARTNLRKELEKDEK